MHSVRAIGPQIGIPRASAGEEGKQPSLNALAEKKNKIHCCTANKRVQPPSQALHDLGSGLSDQRPFYM